MALKIVWSPAARKSFDGLVLFLESKWERKVIEKLFSEVNTTLKSIAANPKMFPVISSKTKLHKCVIRRRTLLLYRVKPGDSIELVLFIDSRQNPKKYKL